MDKRSTEIHQTWAATSALRFKRRAWRTHIIAPFRPPEGQFLPLIFVSHLSISLISFDIQHETRGACPQAQQMVFHLWMWYFDIHTRHWFIAVTWLICLSAWDAQGSEKKHHRRRTKLLTFQIRCSPANGRLTSGVSAGAGNWHAWLPRLPRPPSSDWKLNMSFVSQGWASVQSRFGIRPNARRSSDFMQKKQWNLHAAGLAAGMFWYENTALHYSCLHFTQVADQLTPNFGSYRPFFFFFKWGEFWYFCNIWSCCSPSTLKDKMSL